MGLSFSKQVIRSPGVRVRYVVTTKFQDIYGLVRPDVMETRTFYARNEAEEYAHSVIGTEFGLLRCFVAVLSTEYSRAD